MMIVWNPPLRVIPRTDALRRTAGYGQADGLSDTTTSIASLPTSLTTSTSPSLPTPPALPPLAPAPAPLLRPDRRHGGLLCGVCSGLAAHLGLPTPLVRALMVLLAPVLGFSLVLYVFLWAFVPRGDPRAAAHESPDVAQLPLAKGNAQIVEIGEPSNASASASTRSFADILHDASTISVVVATYTALIPALVIVGMLVHESSPVLTLLFAATGVLADWALRRYPRTSGRISLVTGCSFLMLALLAFASSIGYEDSRGMPLRIIVCVIMLMTAGAMMIRPRIAEMTRRLADERAAKEREEERADMAAHLHDGVLQTLSLIQVNADDPTIVRQLAHAQERELRSWLYQKRAVASESFAAELKDVVADMEARTGTTIETVTVGDAHPDESLTALLEATREALTNATRHGQPPISVYCEVMDDGVDVYVKDHGDGFDPSLVPEGRLGVRESIVGRVRRRGGHVDIDSSARLGTEVHMHMPIAGGLS